jgi:hypothetical protein
MASNNRVSSGHKNINYAADRWQFPATVIAEQWERWPGALLGGEREEVKSRLPSLGLATKGLLCAKAAVDSQ